MTIEIAADNEAFYGFPQESVSSSNAGGKCVTAGETAPVESLSERLLIGTMFIVFLIAICLMPDIMQ